MPDDGDAEGTALPKPPSTPLGPMGVDPTLIAKTLDLEARQVSRADLEDWLTLVGAGANNSSLTVAWREGPATTKYGGDADGRDGAFGPLVASIEQVEEVTSVNVNFWYADDSRLIFWLMVGMTATVRYTAKVESSQAQGLAYALRNRRRQSSAVTRRATDLKLISRLAVGALFLVSAWLLGSVGLTNLPGLQGWLKIVISLGYGALLAYAGTRLLARASRSTSIPQPLVLQYKDPSTWKTEKPWFFVFGIFGAAGAIAAWIVIFYTPK